MALWLKSLLAGDYIQGKRNTRIIRGGWQNNWAQNRNRVRRYGIFQVHVTIHDVNDEAPTPTQSEYEFEVLENVAVGTVVGQVSATDPDLYGEIVYTFTNQSSPFSIDPESGEIRTKYLLDRELVSAYKLEVDVNDGQKSAFVPVRIDLIDVNDNLPEFLYPTADNVYSFSVLEGAQRNSYVGRVTAKDYDQGVNGQVRFRMLNSEFESVFNLNPETGVITVNGYLDHEQVEFLAYGRRQKSSTQKSWFRSRPGAYSTKGMADVFKSSHTLCGIARPYLVRVVSPLWLDGTMNVICSFLTWCTLYVHTL